MIAATIRGSDPDRTRMSAYVIADALKNYAKVKKKLPRGISVHVPAATKWANKNGEAIRKLVRG